MGVDTVYRFSWIFFASCVPHSIFSRFSSPSPLSPSNFSCLFVATGTQFLESGGGSISFCFSQINILAPQAILVGSTGNEIVDIFMYFHWLLLLPLPGIIFWFDCTGTSFLFGCPRPPANFLADSPRSPSPGHCFRERRGLKVFGILPNPERDIMLYNL